MYIDGKVLVYMGGVMQVFNYFDRRSHLTCVDQALGMDMMDLRGSGVAFSVTFGRLSLQFMWHT